MSGSQTADGCTLTFEVDGGELVSVHRSGRGQTRGQILRDVVAALRERYETVLLVSYSTPATILRDLDGSRRDEHANWTPEGRELGRAGVSLDHLHPRLRTSSEKARRNQERRRRARGL